MLTRLKVSGFKNLVDVDVRFGPFTCIAGGNGVGKSNLFDAIRFLSALAEKPLIEAALSVRGEGGRLSDIRGLFHHSGDEYATKMSFEAEMIIPASGTDTLGQPVKAESTFLRYKLEIGYREEEKRAEKVLKVLSEELIPIPAEEIPDCLPFLRSVETWYEAIIAKKNNLPAGAKNDVRGFFWYPTDGFPNEARMYRTLLSMFVMPEFSASALVRQEMKSWRLLNMEPSALRKPDEFTDPSQLGADGSHLPAMLYRIAENYAAQNAGNDVASLYSQVSSRLYGLIDELCNVSVDRDEGRELYTLQVTGRNNTLLPARALSDGTLRFLALTGLVFDPEAQGVICLEEPENGIHPERIPAMLRLLRDIATDVNYPVGPDNPLRQVIINTHSPVVVQQVPADSLLIAETRETIKDGKRLRGVTFSPLPDTWRTKGQKTEPVSPGALLVYLNPAPASLEPPFAAGSENDNRSTSEAPRIADRPDLQWLLPHGTSAE